MATSILSSDELMRPQLDRKYSEFFANTAAASCWPSGLDALPSALLGVSAGPSALAAPKSELDTSWAVEEGYSLRVLARGFSLPTSLAAVAQPGAEPGAPKLFVAELRGTIKVVANDDSVSEFARIATFAPKKDWPDLEGEAGMAGICLDPDHGYVFVTYAYRDASGILRNGISRLRAQPHTFAGKALEQRDIGRFLASEASAFSHQIGNCVVHGGLLYVSIGDAGNPGLSANVSLRWARCCASRSTASQLPAIPLRAGRAGAARVRVGPAQYVRPCIRRRTAFCRRERRRVGPRSRARRWPRLPLEWNGRFDRDECGRRVRADNRPGPDGARGAGHSRTSTFGSRSLSDRCIERQAGAWRGRDGLCALG